MEEEEKEEGEVKEVETPKRNVRNTTRAEVRVKRCEDGRNERSERAGEGGRDRENIWNAQFEVQEGEISAFGEITEESYAHFAESRPKCRRQSRIGFEIALSPPSSSTFLFCRLSSAHSTAASLTFAWH